MSRSRQRLEAMRNVAELRAICAKLSESRAVSTRRELDRARCDVDTQQTTLNAAVSGWQGALADGAFDPVAASFWGQAVNAGEAGVARAKLRQKDCENADEAAREAFGRSTAYERCACDLLSRARFDRASELLRRQDDDRADDATRKFAQP
jgi:hypothetical protein